MAARVPTGLARRLLLSIASVAVLLAPGAVATSHAAETPGNPLAGATFYRDPTSNAARAATALRATDPQTAAKYDRLAAPSAAWFGGWVPADRLTAAVADRVRTARAAGALPVLVAYDIPQRDCGGYSSGGSGSPAAYRTWIDRFARGLEGGRSVVVLEPDALALVDCLSSTDRQTRYTLLREAVTRLGQVAGTTVYLDAGHAGWIDPATMADRLRQAGIAGARGFSLNVSNFGSSEQQMTYGRDLAARTGRRFVVDTSRNGNGRDATGAWCNPAGRALGAEATTATGEPSADALLWIKTPGESDGECGRGEPSAGTWWPSYALGLVGTPAGMLAGFETGLQGWQRTWGSGLSVATGAKPAWSGAAGLGVDLSGAGYPAVGTTTGLAAVRAGQWVTLQVHTPAGAGLVVRPYVFDVSWRPTVLPAQALAAGWTKVKFQVPAVGALNGLGLQIDNGRGWSGRLVIDEVVVSAGG